MNHNDNVQRDDNWFQDRLGRPTASRFKDIMTEPRAKADKEAGKLSDTAYSYMLELLAERITGESKSFSSEATEWGTNNEPYAIQAYQELTGNSVLECGFVKHRTINTGASPDGVIGLDGTIEVKCPFNSVNHLRNKISGKVPKEYIWQVQGQMWICGTDWNDFVSFDPRMPVNAGISIVRVNREDEMIKKLEAKIIAFNELLESKYNKLIDDNF